MRFRSLLVPTLFSSALVACQSQQSAPETAPVTSTEAPLAAVEDPQLPPQSEADAGVESAIGLGVGTAESNSASTAQALEASAPVANGAQGGQDAATRLAVLRQRQQSLAEQYIARGDELLERADFSAALEQYAQALEVNSGSQTARERLRKVEALMGDRYAQASDYLEDAAQQESVRRAQARIAAEGASIDGDNALRAGRFEDALGRYREAELILRYHPLVADNSLDERIVRNKIESTLKLQEEARTAAEKRATESARAAREQAETEQRDYRERHLRTLYTEAYENFQRENYRQAEQLANNILAFDPGNPQAIDMRDIAQAAAHRKSGETNLRDLREQWQRTFDDLETMALPQTEPLIFDDLARWKIVRERQPLSFNSLNSSDQSDRAAVLKRLDETPVRPKFGSEGEGAPLTDIAAHLQTLTGINFMVSPKVLEDLDEEQTSVFLDLEQRSVHKLLDILNETHDFRWKIEDGLVKFVTLDELKGGQVLMEYEVKDLIHAVKDFPGREINVLPSNGIEAPDEELEEREALVVTSDQLEGLIRENIAPESWDADPANALRITNGTLVVNQTPEVHAKISKLLEDLRESTGIMVDIQARFLKVEDSFLEDIGIDFRGLGSPGLGTDANLNDFGDANAQQSLGSSIGQDNSLGAFLDEGNDGDIKARVEQLYDSELGDPSVLTGAGGLSFQWTFLNDLQFEMILRAVSKSERVELVTAPNILVFNTARANLTVLNQVAYVQDFDVEIAQGASIADPIVAVVQDGVILDVRPVVSADRRFVTLEVRPTVAELTRPIGRLTTTLGSQNSVTIQLPQLEISRVRTTVPMPDGGTVLLGGFKVHEQEDLRSGVPFLNKVPLLNFLFERKGNYITNRKLLILLKANIVIGKEHEPTSAQLGVLPGPK